MRSLPASLSPLLRLQRLLLLLLHDGVDASSLGQWLLRNLLLLFFLHDKKALLFIRLRLGLHSWGRRIFSHCVLNLHGAIVDLCTIILLYSLRSCSRFEINQGR